MGVLFGILLLFVVVLALLLGVTIGIAFLLNWLLPAAGMGMSLLVASLVVWQMIYMYIRVIDRPQETWDQDDEDERRPIVILDTDLPPFPSRRRRKRS